MMGKPNTARAKSLINILPYSAYCMLDGAQSQQSQNWPKNADNRSGLWRASGAKHLHAVVSWALRSSNQGSG